MAKFRKRRKFRRGKRNRRRKRRKFRRHRQLIPNRQVRPFIYSDTVDINPGLGTAATHIFSCNGIFDPDVTGAGHQPLGFDQYMGTLYDHATVIHSKIVCHFVSGGGGPIENSTIGITVRDQPTSDANMDRMIEQGRLRYGTLTGSTAQAAKTISMSIVPHKFLGISHPLSNPELRNNQSSNPAEQCYFLIFAAGSDEGDPSTLSVRVRITYTVVLTEPRWAPPS